VLESRDALSSPRWSGDGDALFYMVRRGQTREIRRLRVDPLSGAPVGEPRVLLAGLEADGVFSASGDGGRLAYVRVNERVHLWSASLETAERCAGMRQLTKGTVVDDDPALSPDGRRLAFTRSSGESRNVFVMDLDDGTPRQLTFMEARIADPAWSPDGTEIAFGSSRSDQPHVWRVPAGGGTPTALDQTDVSLNSPQVTWSPDGRLLYHTPGNRNFRLLDLETGSETPLLEQEAGWVFSPKCSPDGSLVAVYRNYTDRLDSGHQYSSLWVIPSGGGDPRQLLDRRAYPIGWSPDGAWIYAREPARGSPGRLLRVAVDGSRVEPICELPPETGDAVWDATSSPDGRTVVLSIGERPSDVWLAEFSGPSGEGRRESRQITPRPDGRSIALH
jgi:Tol biopolymer transport system component